MDKCREEFEAECKKLGYKDSFYFFRRVHPNHYDEENINEMWHMWKASRESMKAIKLPMKEKADNRCDGDAEYCSGYNQALRDCEKQITSAGYKVE